MPVVTQHNFARGTYVDVEDEDESGGTQYTTVFGHVRAEHGNVGAEIKGPNIGAGAVSYAEGDELFAKAELASASFTASNVGGAEMKGPNIGAEVVSSAMGVGAFARAELGSASITSGPVKATVGLSLDTGVGVSADGVVEAKVLGSGFTLGRKVGVSLLGLGFEVELW